MPETEKFQNKLPNQEIDYFKLGKILLSRWYWIACSVFLCMVIAKFYLWYTPKMYSTNATLKFEERKSELSDISGTIISTDRTSSKIISEVSVIQSSKLMLRAIKDLDYKVSFYISGRVRTTEQYPHKPLDIQFITLDTVNIYNDLITYRPVNNNVYNLSYNEGGKIIKKNFSYNHPVTLGPTTFTIAPPADKSIKTIFLFKFNTPESFLGRVKNGFRPGDVPKSSNILPLTQSDSNPLFAADVLNAISNEYLKYDREQKTKSANQIITFIDSQIKFIKDSVNQSERSLQSYKQKEKILSVSSASEAVLAKAKDIDLKRTELNIQLQNISQFKNKLISEKGDINVNLSLSGTADPSLAGLISSYNASLIERNRTLQTYGTNSKPVQDITRQILQFKAAVIENLSSSQESLKKNLAYFDNLTNDVNQQITTLPTAERDMIGLERNFDINAKVYSYLKEKKLDAQISSSAILPGATIVDLAQPNITPISPNDHDITRNAIIIGLVSGLGIIILIRMLNPYIYDKETVESLTTVPIIGVIRKFPLSLDEDNSQLLALSKPRSMFAESVRSVRTNLNFLASDIESKVICITSEVAGEGKSFVAVNLSSTLALINKKVIMIGADLRRSRIHKTFRVPNDMGLSNYLANQATTTDIIHQSEVENLDFITSGPVPPNPSELLHSHRMTNLIAELRAKYDIVIIDTAPIGLVSDSIPLIRVSDINVFVIRSGKSKYHAATIPQRIAQEYQLNNTVIVLNAFEEDLLHSRYYITKFTGESYGTRYYYYSDYSGYASSGYYVDNEEKKWWDIKRWLKL